MSDSFGVSGLLRTELSFGNRHVFHKTWKIKSPFLSATHSVRVCVCAGRGLAMAAHKGCGREQGEERAAGEERGCGRFGECREEVQISTHRRLRALFGSLLGFFFLTYLQAVFSLALLFLSAATDAQ